MGYGAEAPRELVQLHYGVNYTKNSKKLALFSTHYNIVYKISNKVIIRVNKFKVA